MRRPRKGNAREIFDILDEHGPMAYHTIRRHLLDSGSEMKAKQARTAINNLMGRKYIQRSQADFRRYEIRTKQPDFELQLSDPIQTPSPVEKTPERVEITPTDGFTDDRTLGEVKQSILVKAITLAGMLSVISIVSAVTAVLTINFLGVV